MRFKFWVFLNVLIIYPSIPAQRNFAPKNIVSLILFGKATYRKMVQNRGWTSSQYSNLYPQPYFLYLILPCEKYARLTVRSGSFRRSWFDHDDKTIIKNYNNETNMQCFNCNYSHNIHGLQ